MNVDTIAILKAAYLQRHSGIWPTMPDLGTVEERQQAGTEAVAEMLIGMVYWNVTGGKIPYQRLQELGANLIEGLEKSVRDGR